MYTDGQECPLKLLGNKRRLFLSTLGSTKQLNKGIAPLVGAGMTTSLINQLPKLILIEKHFPSVSLLIEINLMTMLLIYVKYKTV